MNEDLPTSTDSITPELAPKAAAPEAPVTAPPEVTPKKRKTLSPEALEKLKIARERAAETNRAKKQERLKAKQEREEEIRATRDPIVVVEQSESDEELTGPPGVIFVRRRRPKPQVPEKSPAEIELEKAYQKMFG
jgi:hypothetical protein